MDLSKIFESFNENEDGRYEGNEVESSSYFNFEQSPIYWVGMYKKIVLNNPKFNKKITKFFKESNHSLDEAEMEEAGEWVTYQRAWDYIERIDINEESHIQAILSYSDEFLETTLKLGISFFEEKEKYENCAHLKKILDKLEEIKK